MTGLPTHAPACLAVVVLLSCQQPTDPRLAKIDQLESKVGEQKEQLDSLKSTLESLENDVLNLQISSGPYKTAEFDPGSPGGYGRIDTTGGTFLVSLQNVTPFVDGFKVTCNFGNPSSATFAGFKLKAKWGPRRDLKSKKMTWLSWQDSLREKELSLTDSLHPASWNTVSFVLSPAKTDEFGYLELSMETSSVLLRK